MDKLDRNGTIKKIVDTRMKGVIDFEDGTSIEVDRLNDGEAELWLKGQDATAGMKLTERDATRLRIFIENLFAGKEL